MNAILIDLQSRRASLCRQLEVIENQLIAVRLAEAMEVKSLLDRILQAVAIEFGVSPKTIEGRSRTQASCDARHAFFYLARKAGCSSTRIGSRIGRDHGTVLHGSEVAEALMETCNQYHERVERLRQRFKREIS